MNLQILLYSMLWGANRNSFKWTKHLYS